MYNRMRNNGIQLNEGIYMNHLACPYLEDYSPCKCSYSKIRKETLEKEEEDASELFVVFCDYIQIETVNELFQWTTPAVLTFVSLFLSFPTNSTAVVIPKDVLEHSITKKIHLQGKILKERNDSKVTEMPLLLIHPEAFRSSHIFLEMIFIFSFDLIRLNFTFLENFKQLELLNIDGCLNVHSLFDFASPLPNLKNLVIKNCRNIFNDATIPPEFLVNGRFKIVILGNNDLRDEDVDRIFDWFLMGPTKDSLRILELNENALTRFPEQIKSFRNIHWVSLSHQKMSWYPKLLDLSSADVPYGPYLLCLALVSSYITDIEPGFFRGIQNFT